jgi:hypothetical protein
MKHYINLLSLFLIVYILSGCGKIEMEMASPQDESFLVYNESFNSVPIEVDDGFVVFTIANKIRYITKFDKSGSKIWQKSVAESYTFSPKVVIINSKISKTPDNGILLSVLYIDTILHKNIFQHVKFVKFDANGNAVLNQNQQIINGIEGEYAQTTKEFEFFNTFQDAENNLVILSHRIQYDTIRQMNIGYLQLSKYNTQNKLISNTVTQIEKVISFWNLLTVKENSIVLIADSDDYSIAGYLPYIFEIDNAGALVSKIQIFLGGYLNYFYFANDNYYFFTNSYYNGSNIFYQFAADGKALKNIEMMQLNKQFLCYAVTFCNNELYFTGGFTNNIFQVSRPVMAWGKISDAGLTYLGEIRSTEETLGLGITCNSNGSLTIIGKKESFEKENLFVLKTLDNGTVSTN